MMTRTARRRGSPMTDIMQSGECEIRMRREEGVGAGVGVGAGM